MSEIVLVSIIIVLSVVIVCEFICHMMNVKALQHNAEHLHAVNKEWKDACEKLNIENIRLRTDRLKKLESITLTKEGIKWNEAKE